MARTHALIGTVGPDGHTYTARRLYRDGAPPQVLAALRRIWRDVFDGDTHVLLRRLLAQDWAFLDPDCAGPAGGNNLVAGIGRMDWNGPPDDEIGDVHLTDAAVGHDWAYLVDDLDDHVLVFEATVHGRWAWHSRHRLQAAVDGLQSSAAPLVGDAATAAHVGHTWRPAVVSLDGLHTAFHAEICTGEHARGVVVARFDPDTLDVAIDILTAFYADRLPGSGLPRLHRHGDTLTVTWYARTGHAQQHHIDADSGGRFVLGPHIWPWILTQEDTPGYDPTALRAGTPPILQWVSPAGFAAAHPDLAARPLPLVCAALTVLHPGRPAVIAAADHAGGPMWLPAPGHALLLTPLSHQPDAGTVVLPRPLGGSATADRPCRSSPPRRSPGPARPSAKATCGSKPPSPRPPSRPRPLIPEEQPPCPAPNRPPRHTAPAPATRRCGCGSLATATSTSSSARSRWRCGARSATPPPTRSTPRPAPATPTSRSSIWSGPPSVPDDPTTASRRSRAPVRQASRIPLGRPR